MTQEEKHYETAPEDRLAVTQKFIYGVGAFGNNLIGGATQGLMIALNLGLGMDPARIGLLGALPRITDALTDPLMGYISDKTRSRWGRRRPYIFIGSIFCGLMFSLLWAMPSLGEDNFLLWDISGLGQTARESLYFWYFLVMSIVFYAAYTMWVTPWVALGYELTPDYHERTRVMGWTNFIGQSAGLLAPWFLWFMQREAFGDVMKGATYLAILISLVMVACGTTCAFFLREKYYDGLLKRDEIRKQERIARGEVEKDETWVTSMKDFFAGFLSVIKFRPFVKLCVTAFLIFNGFMLVSSFTIYVTIYYVCGGDKEFAGELSGQGGTIMGICGFVIVVIVTKLGTFFGKKKALYITTGLSVLGYISKWWLFTPEYPYLSLIPGLFIAFGFGGLFPLVGAMIADVCDMDELESGERREGMFGSIFWWVIKVGMAAALGMGGYMLNWTGFDVQLETQTEQTLFWLRFLDVIVPALTSLCAIFVLLRFELTEEKTHQIRMALEEKRTSDHQSSLAA
jgi:GPH family glycoside/pentoside/hexuronide:cation symporter